jgi:glucose-6-phosphate isomerase, archaeal
MFTWDGPLPEPHVRMAEDLRMVLAERNCIVNGPLYFMYRDLARFKEDRDLLRNQKVRYDVTVIPPMVLCGEYVKTKGHYHPNNQKGIGYPEIYEIIEGSAEYLLQDRQLSDAVVVSAGKGDIVLIPPGYGHVTINPGKATLIMANIVSTEFSSIYEDYEALNGAVYYRMDNMGYIKNPKYPKYPKLRHIRKCNMRGFPALCNRPLYGMVGENDTLRFLNYPEEFNFDSVLKN